MTTAFITFIGSDPAIAGMIPPWADPSLSAELAVLRARGESQDLEYMEYFPVQTTDLAKEIAAFATSNDGLILIGVADNGDLAGLNNAADATARDLLLKRVQGICHGTVKPSITPTTKWAVEEEKVVLAIFVPKGTDPVYYSGNIPYWRHLTESRAAQPHEVIDLVGRFLGVASDAPHPLLQLASSVAGTVCDLVELGRTYPKRRINPHFDDLISQWKYAAERLRSGAATDEANDYGWSSELTRLAEEVEEVVNHRRTIGGDALSTKIPTVVHSAEELYARRVVLIPCPATLEPSALQRIRELAREYASIASRFDGDHFPRNLTAAQRDCELCGFYILHLVWWGLHRIPQTSLQPLREAASEVHLVSTMRTYVDGGQSQKAVVSQIRALAPRLTGAVNALSAKPV